MILKVLTLATMCLLVPAIGRAQIVKVKGKGEGVDERAAIDEARKNALTRYAASLDNAWFENYKKI